jgi:oligopeptide transport system substrate-binding protein
MKNRMWPLMWVVVLALVLSLAGCASPPEEPAATLNFALGAEPTTLDGWLATDVYSWWIIRELLPPLADTDDRSGELVPRLAARWTVSDDGLLWTFFLRDDVFWVQYDAGAEKVVKKRKLTAHDVEYAIKRLVDPSTGSPKAFVVYMIENAQAVNTGKVENLDAVGVESLDDHTVQFRLQEPAAYFPRLAIIAQPREAIEAHGAAWIEPANMWTYGPYALAAWKHDDRLVLARNPHYYGASDVAIETVNMRLAGDSMTLLAMYEVGEVDTTMVSLTELDRLRADPELSKQLRIVSKPATNYLAFNQSKAPAGNRMLRKALSAAIDRQTMIDDVLKGDEIPARTFTPPGVFGSPANNPSFRGITFDPDQAREWLAEAGYPNGEGFPELTLWFSHTSAGGNPFPLLIPFIQQQWKELLGIEVQLTSQEWKMYLQNINSEPPPLWALGVQPSVLDAHVCLYWHFHPTRGADRVRWDADDPAAVRYIAAVEAAAVESDPDVRKALYFEAETILCQEQAAVIPLYHETAKWLTKPYVARTYGRFLDLYKWKVKAH